jgi:hypothetical protein
LCYPFSITGSAGWQQDAKAAGRTMLIKVRFTDNTSGTVDSSIIDNLVRNNEIREIHRANGWVRISNDQARQQRVEEHYPLAPALQDDPSPYLANFRHFFLRYRH